MQGKILDFSVNFADVVADGSIQYDTYELVTNVANLAHNDEILIVAQNGDKYYAATTFVSPTLSTTVVNVSGTTISLPQTDNTLVYRLEAYNGNWTFYDISTGKYFRYGSSANLAGVDSDDVQIADNNNWSKAQWTITISDSKASIKNTVDTTRLLLMDKSSNVFKAYKPGSSYITPSIYKKKVN